MKKIVLALIAISSVSAIHFAQAETTAEAQTSQKIYSDLTDVYSVNQVAVTKVGSIGHPCHQGARCPKVMGKYVQLAITLNGCLDELGPVSVTSVVNSTTGKQDLVISAFGLKHKDSDKVQCFAPNIKSLAVYLGMGSLDVGETLVVDKFYTK